jgi:hypothetical protein
MHTLLNIKNVKIYNQNECIDVLIVNFKILYVQ